MKKQNILQLMIKDYQMSLINKQKAIEYFISISDNFFVDIVNGVIQHLKDTYKWYNFNFDYDINSNDEKTKYKSLELTFNLIKDTKDTILQVPSYFKGNEKNYISIIDSLCFKTLLGNIFYYKKLLKEIDEDITEEDKKFFDDTYNLCIIQGIDIF